MSVSESALNFRVIDFSFWRATSGRCWLARRIEPEPHVWISSMPVEAGSPHWHSKPCVSLHRVRCWRQRKSTLVRLPEQSATQQEWTGRHRHLPVQILPFPLAAASPPLPCCRSRPRSSRCPTPVPPPRQFHKRGLLCRSV